MDPAAVIYATAIQGTQTNPGLPPALANLLIAQARHETGNFTSGIFKDYNNAFGYSFSGSRYQTGPGRIADNGQPVAVYGSVADSTREIVDWIYRRRAEGKFPADLSTITGPDQYAALLKSAGYFGDTLTNYSAGLKKFFTALYQEIEKPATAAVLLAAGFFAWILIKERRRF